MSARHHRATCRSRAKPGLACTCGVIKLPIPFSKAEAVMGWLDLSDEEWDAIPDPVRRKLVRALNSQAQPTFTKETPQ